MFKYWGFGLNILSEIEFPEFLPAEFDNHDVIIEKGKAPEKLEGEGVTKKVMSFISKDEYLLNIKNVCRYYAAHGNKIVADPVAGIDEQSIRLFLLGTVMAAILYQRGSIPLHASAIINKGKLVLFAGNSGAGKSTISAYLSTQGYKMFTDDMCVMHNNLPDKTGVYCTASYPMMKLWDDTLNDLGNKLFTRDFKVRPKLPKYGQFFYEDFNSSTLPVDKIFILNNKSLSSEVAVALMPPVQAFKQLELQAYKHQLISGKKLRGVHFSLLADLCGNVPVYDLSRPATGTSIESLYQEIKHLF